jgi:hypothetical protein
MPKIIFEYPNLLRGSVDRDIAETCNSALRTGMDDITNFDGL